jgi:O-antigen/teichoic acid export membrane protein
MTGNSRFLNLLLLYLLLSSPVCLVEYIYLLRGKSYRILQYGIYTFTAQLAVVILPVMAGKDIIWAIYGMLFIAGIRWIWLLTLLVRYAKWEISPEFMREHMKLGLPLIVTSLISGSAQYIDGIIVSSHFDDPRMFAIFRYGAKEFPLVLLMANGLSNAMLPMFGTRGAMKDSLEDIKRRSRNLMHYLFPASIFFLITARWFYPRLFTPDFIRSADIFMIYIMLVIPRLVFPQTIIIGRKRTRITLFAAILEISLNIPLSLWLVQYYGAVGVALATFIVYFIEKIYLAGYLWTKMKIKPNEYIPLVTYAIYTVILTIVFILVDHRIVDIH